MQLASKWRDSWSIHPAWDRSEANPVSYDWRRVGRSCSAGPRRPDRGGAGACGKLEIALAAGPKSRSSLRGDHIRAAVAIMARATSPLPGLGEFGQLAIMHKMLSL